MKVLVTGGTGHLGRAIVARLREDGHGVRILKRRRGDTKGLEWREGDLATGAGVGEAVAGVDAIVHAATNSPAAQRGGFRLVDFVRSERFFAAARDGDVDAMAEMLAANVVVYGDGGGKARRGRARSWAATV
jgi:nucleoside-diphosphate-sugar epimerase